MKIKEWMLKQRQGLSLDEKIQMSLQRIRIWHYHYEGQVYVSFSGGKDSSALLHLVRSEFPDVPAVFSDTGLEYPENKEIVKRTKNVTIIRPRKTFKAVIEEYGYPVPTKSQAQYIWDYRNTFSDKLRKKRWEGDGATWWDGRRHRKLRSRQISDKWKFLVDAPFKISDKCCYYLKKYPFAKYEKDTGRKPILGTLAYESILRKQSYLKHGCNNFYTSRPASQPLAFWLENDIENYIKRHNIPISSIYKKGVHSTGCMFCLFGVHLEDEPNRFQRMKKTHPKLWDYCINKLDLRQVLDYIGVKYE